jgi:hypothetical protein
LHNGEGGGASGIGASVGKELQWWRKEEDQWKDGMNTKYMCMKIEVVK